MCYLDISVHMHIYVHMYKGVYIHIYIYVNIWYVLLMSLYCIVTCMHRDKRSLDLKSNSYLHNHHISH